jgi:hypothetical protein
LGRILGRVTSAPPPERTAWSDADVVAALAGDAGLVLDATTHERLAIRAASPEAYIASGQEHPMAVATRPVLERAGAADEVRQAMTTVLREANEEPGGFLVHSPYVIHALSRA